jgi:RNA polymerase sigma-70 factor (ECF subfamily)
MSEGRNRDQERDMNAGVRALEAGTSREDARRLDFPRRVEETRRRVFRIAYAVLGNPEDAEEVAQETYLRAYRRIRSLRSAEKFGAWVGRIALRLALNRRRQRHRRLARETRWQSERPVAAAARSDAATRLDLARLRRRIDALPEKYRSVLVLSGVQGMTSAEVARVLGIRAETVRSRLHEARRRLLEEAER